MQNINETVYETKSGRLTIVRPPPAQPAETAGWSEDCMRACALGAKVQLVPARKTQGWLNMACPAAKTPPAIVERLAAEIGRIVKEPGVCDKLLAAGVEPLGLPTAEAVKFFEREKATYSKLAKARNIKADD